MTGSVIFFVVFHAFRNLYIPHPKPPFFQQVPLACWWLSGVFPHILLILEHKIGCFVVVSMVFSCKSRCVRRLLYTFTTYSSVLLFRARSNTLNLNTENRHRGGNTICNLCGEVEENLVHFVMLCPELREIRQNCVELQQPYEEDFNQVVGKFLFKEENIETKKEILYRMWKKREKMIKNLQS